MNTTVLGKQAEKKVLVIDDEMSILEALAFMLSDAGYSVKTATSSDKLRNIKDGELPDLILLDVLLSGEDGRDIARMLKSKNETKHIPIIMISAHPSAHMTIKECGADDFLPKPFDIDELLLKIKQHLSKN